MGAKGSHHKTEHDPQNMLTSGDCKEAAQSPSVGSTRPEDGVATTDENKDPTTAGSAPSRENSIQGGGGGRRGVAECRNEETNLQTNQPLPDKTSSSASGFGKFLSFSRSSMTRKLSDKMKKRGGSHKGSHGGCGGGGADQTGTPPTSPAMIRRQQLEELRHNRPCLGERQVETTRHTWLILQDHLGTVGEDMFMRLFETYPDVKGAFGPFRSLSADDARYNIELRAHGLRVLKTVETVVTMQNNPEELINHLHELGTKHITFNAKVDYMDIVGQQFLFAIEPVLEEHWNTEVESAWADLFRFMAHVMKEAMML